MDEQQFAYRGDFITLGNLLKATGLVGTGGEGKSLIEAGAIQVNGQVENRRGRKLVDGDLVVIAEDVSVRLIGAGGA